MAQRGTLELQDFREALEDFDQKLEEGDYSAIDSLTDALEELGEIEQSSSRNRTLADNLTHTYARRTAEHAAALLENLNSTSDQQMALCHHAMLQFERRLGSKLPDRYCDMRFRLAEAIAERVYSASLSRTEWSHAEGPFVASRVGGHFHRPNCKWALEIFPGNRVEFASHEAAVRAGYRPCKYGCQA